MKLPRFTYHRPDSLDEAVALLAEHDDAKVLAGGQSLIPLMAMRLGQPGHLVDIGRLTELDGIRDIDGELAIGAGVTHAAAERSVPVQTSAAAVAHALPHIGHAAIRSRGTVCGSIAHADPAAELPAVALAAGAVVVARSVRGERQIAAADFFDGYLSTALEPDELVVEVRFPSSTANAGAAVHEISRRHGDFALIGAVAIVHLDPAGAVSSCALAYFGADAVPRRVEEAEAVLVGGAPTADGFAEAAEIAANQLEPPDDIHASRAYRKHIAGVLTRRALADAVDRARVSA
jgi:aerobic carbon-monoxide dehydrogenase medium subunit